MELKQVIEGGGKPLELAHISLAVAFKMEYQGDSIGECESVECIPHVR